MWPDWKEEAAAAQETARLARALSRLEDEQYMGRRIGLSAGLLLFSA
jgi:hypothetical protein